MGLGQFLLGLEAFTPLFLLFRPTGPTMSSGCLAGDQGGQAGFPRHLIASDAKVSSSGVGSLQYWP